MAYEYPVHQACGKRHPKGAIYCGKSDPPSTDELREIVTASPRKAPAKKIADVPVHNETVEIGFTLTEEVNPDLVPRLLKDPPQYQPDVYFANVCEEVAKAPKTIQDFLRGIAAGDEDIAPLLNDAANELDMATAEVLVLRAKLDERREYLRQKQKESRDRKKAK